MTRIEELEAAVTALAQDEYAQFRQWFLARDWENWDQQIEEDSHSGKLDFLFFGGCRGKEEQRLSPAGVGMRESGLMRAKGKKPPLI